MSPSLHYTCGKISFAKQWGQLGVIRCSSSGIGLCRAKTFQRTLIICDSLSSSTPPRTKLSSSLLVQTIGVSRVNSMSWEKCVFGAGRCTFCPFLPLFANHDNISRHEFGIPEKLCTLQIFFPWKSRNMACNKIKTLYFMLWLCSTVKCLFCSSRNSATHMYISLMISRQYTHQVVTFPKFL